jgi:hypothetical protein
MVEHEDIYPAGLFIHRQSRRQVAREMHVSRREIRVKMSA